MRVSAAALSIIQESNAWLVQWNENWHAYSLIGGHVEPGETFRECCVREVAEELECSESVVEAAPDAYATLRFCEYSKAAKEETDYQWQAFITRLPASTLSQLPSNCAWVTADEIRSAKTVSGQPIADQVRRVLKTVEEAESVLR